MLIFFSVKSKLHRESIEECDCSKIFSAELSSRDSFSLLENGFIIDGQLKFPSSIWMRHFSGLTLSVI